jgi:hemerythrin
VFEWKQTYSVGIPSIDAQHQNLFAIAHELYSAMGTGQSKAVMARILERLSTYTEMHFAHEERLMKQHEYPDTDQHARQHMDLYNQVLKFQEDYKAGRAAMSVSVLKFLKHWLEDHILGSDMAYSPYLRARAVL